MSGRAAAGARRRPSSSPITTPNSFPVADDRRLFDKLCLEGFQRGLSWRAILAKRENFRGPSTASMSTGSRGFADVDVERLLKDHGIVRHRGKAARSLTRRSGPERHFRARGHEEEGDRSSAYIRKGYGADIILIGGPGAAAFFSTILLRFHKHEQPSEPALPPLAFPQPAWRSADQLRRIRNTSPTQADRSD